MQKEIKLNNGYSIPSFGLGTWKSQTSEVGKAVRFALEEANYKHIDCAAIYGNESEIGEVFKDVFSKGKIKREDIFITSKLWNSEHKKEDVIKACKQTLSDLKLDSLDLYLIHWGISTSKNPGGTDENGYVKTDPIPLQETWEAMEELVEQGLVKSIGVSNFTYLLLNDLLTYCKIKPVINQIEIHPYNSQVELIKFMKAHDIIATAYSPLGTPSELDAGEPKLLEDKIILEIAKRNKITPGQVLLRWGLQRGTVIIPKSTSPKRIKENIEVYNLELSNEDMEEINKLNKNYRFLNPVSWWGIPYFN